MFENEPQIKREFYHHINCGNIMAAVRCADKLIWRGKMGYFIKMTPTKAMWDGLKNDLLKRESFRVVDVEKLTIPPNPTREEENNGMIQARTMMDAVRRSGDVEWRQKTKEFHVLRFG